MPLYALNNYTRGVSVQEPTRITVKTTDEKVVAVIEEQEFEQRPEGAAQVTELVVKVAPGVKIITLSAGEVDG